MKTGQHDLVSLIDHLGTKAHKLSLAFLPNAFDCQPRTYGVSDITGLYKPTSLVD
jgi:hypothetical protein